MKSPTTIDDVKSNPLCLARQITTPGGLEMTFRPLVPADGAILGKYFCGLSETTKSLYGPHPFDQATADRLCASIDYADTIRMIAVLCVEAREEVVGYFILQLNVPESEIQRYAAAGITLDPARDCLVAPSVADLYQSKGLGTPLMEHVFNAARSLDRRYVVLMGGVFLHNERGVHYYRKLGFETIGTFDETGPRQRRSYDMYKKL